MCCECNKTDRCFEPFPLDECENFEHKYTDAYILQLFKGTSKTMQKSIIEILEVTQGREEMK